MAVSVRDIDTIATLGLGWAHVKYAEGVHDGRIFAGDEPEIGAQQSPPAVVERDAFRAFANKINALRDQVRQGEESKEAEAVTARRTIETLEELDALPVKAVVIEDHYQDAYQKIATDSWMSGEYTVNGPAIALPCTVIYEPGVK
jgi:hypothetical protein